MTVIEMEILLSGSKIWVCNEEGYIEVNLDTNMFVAVLRNGFFLNCNHLTFESAVKEIEEWVNKNK